MLVKHQVPRVSGTATGSSGHVTGQQTTTLSEVDQPAGYKRILSAAASHPPCKTDAVDAQVD